MNYVMVGIIAVTILVAGGLLLSSFKTGNKSASKLSQTRTEQTKSETSNNGVISDEEIFNLWNAKYNKYKGCKNISIENFRVNGYGDSGFYQAKISYDIAYRAPSVPKRYASGDMSSYFNALRLPHSGLAEEYLEGCGNKYSLSGWFCMDMERYYNACWRGNCKKADDFLRGKLKDDMEETLTLIKGDKGWMIESRF